MPNSDKILSHRLRGTPYPEHTFQALSEICKYNIPYLEVDTRVSKDGEIYLRHDAKLGKAFSISGNINSIEAFRINKIKHQSGENILSLKNALEYFKMHSKDNQKFCIDIKDYGFEKEHLQIVRESGLNKKVCFISWIPQAILRLFEINKNIPLILFT